MVESIRKEILRLLEINNRYRKSWRWKISLFRLTILGRLEALEGLLSYIDHMSKAENLDSIRDKAEEYSFNISSPLCQTLTDERQKMWKVEIESAFMNGYITDRE